MDDKGLREAIQVYFEATNVSDAEGMAGVFHDSAHLYQVGEGGALSDWDKDCFMGIIRSGRETGPAFEPYNEILSIDFTSEDTAVVRLKVRVRNLLYTDILSFIRLEGKWWIIAKLAVGVPC